MSLYEIRIKETALENLKASRARVLERLGSAKVASALTGLSPDAAGALANDLLQLLDDVDRVVSRAKKVD